MVFNHSYAGVSAVWPTGSYKQILSGFGFCQQTKHKVPIHVGIDISVPAQKPVYSICDGEVTNNNTKKSYWDSFLVVKHNCSGRTVYGYYGHVTSSLKVGNSVKAGQSIATIRHDSGYSDHSGYHPGYSDHLHFATSTSFKRSDWGYVPNTSSCSSYLNPSTYFDYSSSSGSTSSGSTSTSSSGYRKTPVNLTIHGVTSINEDSSTSYTTKVRYSDGTSKNVSSSWTEYSSYTKFSGSRLYTTSISSDQKVYIKASYTENGVKVEAGINVTIKNKTYSYNSSSSSSSSSGSSSSSSSTSASSVIYSFYYKNYNYFGSRKGSTYTSGSYTYQDFYSGMRIRVKKSGSYYYIEYYDGRTWRSGGSQRA
jgi:hypothetical protein